MANVGEAAAHDVTVSIELSTAVDTTKSSQCTELSLSTLLPGAKFRHYLVSVPNKDQIVIVRSTYNDTLGSYKREFKQLLAGLFGHRRIGHHPGYNATPDTVGMTGRRCRRVAFTGG
jgi:hypothetical protein